MSCHLLEYVKKNTYLEYFYPYTLFRELRQLRIDKKINYEVKDKASMIYYIKKRQKK